MRHKISVSSVKDRMPVRYRVHPLLIFFKVVLALALIVPAIVLLVNKVDADTPLFFKLAALMVLYIGLDSVFRHTTSLSSVIFTQECLWLRFPLKPSIPIPWDKFISMRLHKRITYYLYLEYTDLKGQNRTYKTVTSFPKMTEILYNISELAPHIQVTGELEKIILYLRELVKVKQEG